MLAFIPSPDFSQFEIISTPCADRESRIFQTTNERSNKVCYRAYSLFLARDRDNVRGCLTILIEHGAGREALRIGSIYGVEADWILQITDERRLYAALWALYNTAKEARDNATALTANKYASAFAEGRLKKRRRNRRVYVEIEPAATAVEGSAA